MNYEAKAKELVSSIEKIECRYYKGNYPVIAIIDGEEVVLRKAGNRPCGMVQLYDGPVNGNVRGQGMLELFKFAKSIDSVLKESHLKSFKVEIIED